MDVQSLPTECNFFCWANLSSLRARSVSVVLEYNFVWKSCDRLYVIYTSTDIRNTLIIWNIEWNNSTGKIVNGTMNSIRLIWSGFFCSALVLVIYFLRNVKSWTMLAHGSLRIHTDFVCKYWDDRIAWHLVIERIGGEKNTQIEERRRTMECQWCNHNLLLVADGFVVGMSSRVFFSGKRGSQSTR